MVAPVSCRLVITKQLDDMLANGAAWKTDLEQPGTPIAPGTGEPSPNALGQAVGRAGLPRVAGICGLITTAFTARMLAFEEMVGSEALQSGSGPPSSGPPSSAQQRRFLQHLANASPSQRAGLVNAILYGQPGAPPVQVTSVQVQLLTSSPDKVTMNVTSNFSQYGGSGAESTKVTAWKIGGRWFVTSFAGFTLH